MSATMTEITQFHYDANYPYFQTSLESSYRSRHRIAGLFRSFTEVFIPLHLRNGDSILDIGCNIGDLGYYLSFLGISTIGIDINIAAL